MRFAILFCLVLSFYPAGAQTQGELRKSIYFGGGSYDIDDAQSKDLTRWLDSIPKLETYKIQLISHTDPIGGEEYNAWLSKMRSDAVLRMLVNYPIPEKSISIKDWGLENPVYTNLSYQGMQLNRSVDIILYPIIF